MKILIVTHHFTPHVSGVGFVAEKQAKSLVKNGVNVTVLTSDCSDRPGMFKKDGYTLHRLRALNFMETRFGAPFPIFSPSLTWRTYKLVKNADAVHIHDSFYMSSIMAAVWAKLLHKPLFATQHVTIVDHPSKLIMAMQKVVYKTVGKLIYKQARAIVVYNANVKDFLVSLGIADSKILQRYMGIDTKFFSPINVAKKHKLKLAYKLPVEKPVVLFVGRLVPKKGFDLVFNAQSDDYTTVIVGGGQIPKHMQQIKDVLFFGPASQQQLLDLYRLSDVFVFPAVGEIFTLVMQEAMACGLPVITTDDSGYSNYSLDHRLVRFIKRESHTIKREVCLLLSDVTLNDNASRYSRKLALEKFSWHRNYPEEFGIYGSLVEVA